MRYFVIWKGNMDVTGVAPKINAMKIVVRFLEKTAKAKVYDGKHSFLIIMPETVGDPVWMKENVIREGDIVGVTSDDLRAQERADKLVEKYDNAREGKRYAGTAVLKYWLAHFYLQFDEWGSE